MRYEIIAVPVFRKELKRLTAKYPSLKNNLAALFDQLEIRPVQGTPLGKNCYKIRLSIASKGRGKSGGARIITHIVVAATTVYLLSIYDKSQKDNLTNQELSELLKEVAS